MRGHCILSHGFESGPDATKVTALAEVAETLGWTHERPDYTDLDAKREISELGDVPARLQRLLTIAKRAAEKGPIVLAGSSLGSYISGRVSLEVKPAGLFMMVPPLKMGTMPDLDAAAVPTSIIHAWNDELIPVNDVVTWARQRAARLLIVDDGHRLSDHVQTSADAFAALLTEISR